MTHSVEIVIPDRESSSALISNALLNPDSDINFHMGQDIFVSSVLGPGTRLVRISHNVSPLWHWHAAHRSVVFIPFLTKLL